MTLYNFNGLDEQEQIEAIWSKGVSLGKRSDETNDFELIQIDVFYVEIKYTKNEKNIVDLRTFRSTELLTPYLDQIDLKKLCEQGGN